MKEQSEEYDSEEDPEYVPPSIIYETDKEYDEYSDGGDAIPQEEVENLLKEVKKPLEPPASYIPIWVPVPSPAEKIARAKEQVENTKDESKSETSGKDTDSNGKKDEDEAKKVNANDDGKKAVEGETAKVDKKGGLLESGLTPIMKKLNVDDKVKEVEENDKSKKVKEGDVSKVDDKQLLNKSSKCEESNDVPKPKRERKKSKSKGGDGDAADQAAADAAKESDAPLVSNSGDVNNAEKGEDGKIAAAKIPNVVAGSEKPPAKTDTEKGKKSPSKKNSGKAGSGEN